MWWSIEGAELLKALRRVGAGEDPDEVYIEMYVNAEVDYSPDDES